MTETTAISKPLIKQFEKKLGEMFSDFAKDQEPIVLT